MPTCRVTGSGGTVEGQLRVRSVARLRVFRTKHSKPLSFAAKVWQRDLCGFSIALALRLGGGKRPSGKGVVSEGERQDHEESD